jgi:5-methylcytosine-specific restriction enzyme subunit McrC
MFEFSNETLVGNEEFDNTYNLLTRIFNHTLKHVIKKGFFRSFLSSKEELRTVRGKINVSETINKGLINTDKIICEYDEFSSNGTFNQIIKSTLSIISRSKQIESLLQIDTRKLLSYFDGIKDIQLSPTIFSSLQFNRNNRHYRLLITVCEHIYFGLLSNQDDKESVFMNFFGEEQMHILFEKFVLNFYKRKLNRKDFLVHSPKFHWNSDENISSEAVFRTPEMKTDIAVEDKTKNIQLIIDTKYYPNALVSTRFGENKKYHAGHLYQINAYLDYSDFTGKKVGMLLYPTVEFDLNNRIGKQSKPIFINTVNLSKHWSCIEDELLRFLTEAMNYSVNQNSNVSD